MDTHEKIKIPISSQAQQKESLGKHIRIEKTKKEAQPDPSCVQESAVDLARQGK